MIDPQIYQIIPLPFVIFLARICDVSLGTLRIVFISKGKRNIAPILGFFEVFIWVVVISEIFRNVGSMVDCVAYAGGYAAGNYVGMLIEERLAIGTQLIKVFSAKDITALQKCLNEAGFGTTVVDGEGSEGKVKILYTVIDRKTADQAKKILIDFDPLIFYVVEDVRLAKSGIFPDTKQNTPFHRIFLRGRPGK